MGRREDRVAIQSTWGTYTPRTPGTPLTRWDMENAIPSGQKPEPEEPPTTIGEAKRAMRKAVRR